MLSGFLSICLGCGSARSHPPCASISSPLQPAHWVAAVRGLTDPVQWSLSVEEQAWPVLTWPAVGVERQDAHRRISISEREAPWEVIHVRIHQIVTAAHAVPAIWEHGDETLSSEQKNTPKCSPCGETEFGREFWEVDHPG